MINIAVIGTNWITNQFIEAAIESKQFKWVAVYSRSIEKARMFSDKYQLELSYFDDLYQLAQDKTVDAVYIATPNSLHAEQSILMLQHGKHVICEKPIASTPKQLEEMLRVATEHHVILFEAMKTYYLPNYDVVKHALPSLGQLRHVSLNFCQYSSRYPLFLEGKNPNTFNPEFDNGSVMDIGVYCISFAVGLWGKPIHVNASAVLLHSGVDGCGVIQLIFEQKDGDPFEVVISHSKVSNGFLPSEIQGEEGSLLIEHLSHCEKVTWIDRKTGIHTDLTQAQAENTMCYEAIAFAESIQNKRENRMLAESVIVNQIVREVREQTGVIFKADQC